MKHTPGPYSYNFEPVTKQWRIIGQSGYATIAMVATESNAVFIASAMNKALTTKATQD